MFKNFGPNFSMQYQIPQFGSAWVNFSILEENQFVPHAGINYLIQKGQERFSRRTTDPRKHRFDLSSDSWGSHSLVRDYRSFSFWSRWNKRAGAWFTSCSLLSRHNIWNLWTTSSLAGSSWRHRRGELHLHSRMSLDHEKPKIWD